jgi:hypothetical protein
MPRIEQREKKKNEANNLVSSTFPNHGPSEKEHKHRIFYYYHFFLKLAFYFFSLRVTCTCTSFADSHTKSPSAWDNRCYS